MPFVGPAGRELNDLLRNVGIDRAACYVTNVVPWKLEKNDFKVMYQDAKCMKPTAELEAQWERLRDELLMVKPNVIVALGDHAMHALTGLRGIGNWRGSILETRWGAKCIPTFHPSYTMQYIENRPMAVIDLKKVLREASSPKIYQRKKDFIIRPTLGDIEAYFAKVKEVGKVAVDIETQWGKVISCIGFSCHRDSAICIPFYDERGQYWESSGYEIIKGMIAGVLGNRDIKKIGQNFHYDWCYLKRDGYEVNNFWFDTWAAQHSAWPELPKTLNFIASIYTNENYWKEERKNYNNVKDWDKFWRYNCKDASITFECVEPLKSELKSLGSEETFEFQMKLIPLFVEMTLRGIKIDTEMRDEITKEILKRIDETNDLIAQEVPNGWVCPHCQGRGEIGKRVIKVCPQCEGRKTYVNPLSPSQLMKLLYGELGIPRKKKRGKEGMTVDEDALTEIAAKHPHPIIKAILQARGLNKALSYASMPLYHGRIQTTLSCSTSTERLASSESPFYTGGNLQNIPRSGGDERKVCKGIPFRRMFIADDDHLLYGPDYEKAEAMCVAYLSDDPFYIEMFEKGLDIHRVNAQTIFEKEVISDDERQLGKKVCHGLNYGMGPRTLCQSIIHELGPEYAISEAEAKRFKAAYFGKFEGIKRWHEEILEELKRTRTLVNPFGMRRTFLGRPESVLKEAIAFLPQSTVARLTNMALVRLSTIEMIELLLQVHDQILAQAHVKHEPKEVIQVITDAMMIPIKGKRREFVIPVEMKYGKNWEDLKKWKGGK